MFKFIDWGYNLRPNFKFNVWSYFQDYDLIIILKDVF
jgi:hypothetical protein